MGSTSFVHPGANRRFRAGWRHLSWSGLALLPGSFAKGSLQQAHSDLVFSARIADGEGSIRFYLLFEHRTTVDPVMPLRLLGCVTELLLAHEKQQGQPLPPAIPDVLHQEPDRGLGLPGSGRAEPRADRHGLARRPARPEGLTTRTAARP